MRPRTATRLHQHSEFPAAPPERPYACRQQLLRAGRQQRNSSDSREWGRCPRATWSAAGCSCIGRSRGIGVRSTEGGGGDGRRPIHGMDAETHRVVFLAVGAAVGYAVVMAAIPRGRACGTDCAALRATSKSGCCRRLFAWRTRLPVCAVRYEGRLIADAPPVIVPWSGWQPPPWSDALAAGWLPAAESAARIFNCIVTTFPLSALVALCFWSTGVGIRPSSVGDCDASAGECGAR